MGPPTKVVFYPKVNYSVISLGSYKDGENNCYSTVLNQCLYYLKSDGKIDFLDGTFNTINDITVIGDSLYFIDACQLNVSDLSHGRTIISNPLGFQFAALCQDNNHNLYLSSQNQLYIYNLDSQDLKVYDFGINPDSLMGVAWSSHLNKLLVVTRTQNSRIMALKTADTTLELIKETGIPYLYGITQDSSGNFYVSGWTDNTKGSGKIYKFDKDFANPPAIFATGLTTPAHIYYNTLNDTIVVPCWSADSIVMISALLPGPGLVRVGEENQPVTTTPTFHWLNIGSDSYQLQVALSTSSAIKDDEPMATGDFEHPLIDVKNITDTFFVSPIIIEHDTKYAWRVRGVKAGTNTQWSAVRYFTRGLVDGVEEELSKNYTFSISPNPVSDFINISAGLHCNEPLHKDVQIYNTLGELILNVVAVHELPLQINVTAFAPGVYFLRYGNETRMFVKE
jgi:hypothetical protein